MLSGTRAPHDVCGCADLPLRPAVPPQILSAGRGEALCVVFVDARGGVAELGPPCLQAGGREDAAQWKSLAAKAVRVYVRALGPGARAVGALGSRAAAAPERDSRPAFA